MSGKISAHEEVPFNRYPWRYLGLTLGWTWAFWFTAALAGYDYSHPLTLFLFITGGLGPPGAALVLAHRERGRDGLRDIWRRLIEVRRIGSRWYLWIAVVVLAPHLGMVLIDWIVWGNSADIRSAGSFLASPIFALAILAYMLVVVTAEEIGWRGYGLDPLLKRYSPSGASLILGFAWAIWHLPLYFIPGTFLHDSVGLGTGRYWAINLAIPLLAILHTVLYQNTARSIFSAVIFHVGWNIAGEAFTPEFRADLIRLILLLGLTIGVVFIYWKGTSGRISAERSIP